MALTPGRFARPERGGIRLWLPHSEVARRYHVDAVLGSSGSSAAYEVTEIATGRPAVLKILRPEGRTTAVLDRLARRLLAVRDVESENVLRVFEVERAGEALCIVAERADGEPLSRIVARGRLPHAAATALFEGILQGLAALHGAGLIHGDLSPGNVLVIPEGSVKLADAGVPSPWERMPAGSETQYLSPEAALFRPLDVRSDLYSAGVLLFEMLTGHTPFDEASSLGSVVARVTAESPDVRGLAPEVPAWLASVTSRLLQKEPSERYASAEDVLDDVRAKRPPAPRTVVRKRPRPLRFALAAVLAFAAWDLIEVRRPGLAELQPSPAGGTLAVTATGEVLFHKPDLLSSLHATQVSLEGFPEPLLAAVLLGGRPDADAARLTLSFLDSRTGALVRRASLPPLPSMLTAPEVTVSRVVATDVDGDGASEVLVVYTAQPGWPADAVLFDPLRDRGTVVFSAISPIAFLAEADLEDDGLAELIFTGPNPRFGLEGVAAVRVPRTVYPGRSAWAMAPGLPGRGASPGLLWYALVPPWIQRSQALAPRYLLAPEERAVAIQLAPGKRVLLDFSGFFRMDRGSLAGRARLASRERSYSALDQVFACLDEGENRTALGALARARDEAQEAGDRALLGYVDALHQPLRAMK